jgi:AcrR family transcriptional regulator
MDEDIKDKILRGAENLFNKYGIRSVSMDDIARHLSISKKTIYQYFADKDDLVTLMATTHLQRERTMYEAIHTKAENAIHELALISACLKKSFEELNTSMIFDLQKYHPKAWNVFVEFENKHVHAAVVKNIKQGMAEGFFRADLNPDVLAKARIKLVQLCIDSDTFPRDRYNLAEVQLHLFEHFVYGLVTEKGRKQFEKYKNHYTLNPLLISTI